MAQSSGDDPRTSVTESDGRAAGPGTRGWPGGQAGYGPPARLWGTRPGRLGVLTVAAGAVAGVILTVLTGSEPGALLGVCVILATALGAFMVSAKAAYVVIPVPALAYYIHDRAVDTSATTFGVSAVQWIASGFFAMCGATLLAIGIAAGRSLFSGPGPRRAWRDLPARRSAGPRRYPAPGQERDAEYPAPGSLPAGPRHSA
jgi:hypothetical protein